MAVSKCSRQLLQLNTAKEIGASSSTFTTTANTAFGIECAGGDYKTLITFANASGSSGTVTLKCGNAHQKKGQDLTFTVANGKKFMICVDSGYFKNIKDTDTSEGDKGCIRAVTTQVMTVDCIELPQ